jgi:hypothetical protein
MVIRLLFVFASTRTIVGKLISIPYYEDVDAHSFDENECVWDDPWIQGRPQKHPIM